MIPEPVSLDVFEATCDWGEHPGYAMPRTVGYRWWPSGWVSVCQIHYDEAAPEHRRPLYEQRLARLGGGEWTGRADRLMNDPNWIQLATQEEDE